jgi:hypothetical protein
MAHLYDGETQQCSTPHGHFVNGGKKEVILQTFKPEELSPWGTPYGRCCQRCVRAWREHQRRQREA